METCRILLLKMVKGYCQRPVSSYFKHNLGVLMTRCGERGPVWSIGVQWLFIYKETTWAAFRPKSHLTQHPLPLAKQLLTLNSCGMCACVCVCVLVCVCLCAFVWVCECFINLVLGSTMTQTVGTKLCLQLRSFCGYFIYCE